MVVDREEHRKRHGASGDDAGGEEGA
jgi:hypothetical protein